MYNTDTYTTPQGATKWPTWTRRKKLHWLRLSRQLSVTITSGEIDFISNFADCARAANRECGVETAVRDQHLQVNTYWLETSFAGRALEALQAIKLAMSKGNHDRSDIQTDYFDVGWHIDISIGKWNKPYVVTG